MGNYNGRISYIKRGIVMIMIPTKYPYGSVNINEIRVIEERFDRYYFYDKCGKWEIEKETYDYLERVGVKRYERKGNAY